MGVSCTKFSTQFSTVYLLIGSSNETSLGSHIRVYAVHYQYDKGKFFADFSWCPLSRKTEERVCVFLVWWPFILKLMMTVRELLPAGLVQLENAQINLKATVRQGENDMNEFQIMRLQMWMQVEKMEHGGREKTAWMSLHYYKAPDVDARRKNGSLTAWSRSPCVNPFYVIWYCEWNWKNH